MKGYNTIFDSLLKGMEEYYSKELMLKVKRYEQKSEEEKGQSIEVKGVC